MKKTPTYLTLRNGVYYFQLRLPARLETRIKPANGIFRKSTRTRNRKEAIQTARIWWVQIMTNEIDPKLLREMETWESELEDHKRMVDRGREIVEQFERSGIDENDYYAVEDFFQHYTTTDFKCFVLAKEYLESIKKQKESHEPLRRTVEQERTPEISGTRLSDIRDNWIHFNTEVRSVENRWKPASKKKFVSQVDIMIHMTGNPLAHEFKKNVLRDEFAVKLPLIPKSIKQRKIFRENQPSNSTDLEGNLKPIDEIIELAQEQGIEPLKPRTVRDYATNISTFLRWAAKNDYISPNIDSILDVYREMNSEDQRRKAFNESEIKSLFETPDYQEGRFFPYPERHWVPLIALYTGCRLGEASQLDIENIAKEKESGIWYFDFTNEDNKTLKTKKSKRKVPVHDDLISLGLINYRDHLANKHSKQLFPNLNPDSNGHWGRHVSRWFNGETIDRDNRRLGYKEKCGLVTNENCYFTFHSFRHFVVNLSKQNSSEGSAPKWDYLVWCEITGHSSGGETERQSTYEEEFDLTTKKREIDKLRLSFLDVQSIAKWE